MPMKAARLLKHCGSPCALIIESTVHACLNRATKGAGQLQPIEWQDAGVILEHPELAGVHMPKGGLDIAMSSGATLQHNEVRYASSYSR